MLSTLKPVSGHGRTRPSSLLIWMLAVGFATARLSATDLLQHPDLPPGILYASGITDLNPAQIVPVIGDPTGAYSGSDYYLVQTGTVLNPGSTYGGIVFDMPAAFLNQPVPQRYRFEYALRSADGSAFDISVTNQDGGGQVNRLSHIIAVSPDWRRYTHYATLDGQDYGGHANIPRRSLFYDSSEPVGGPAVSFLIDDLTLTPILVGDFDEDDDYDCADVDALVFAIVAGFGGTQFDLTGDGEVDSDDLDEWRSAAGIGLFGAGKSVLEGDANLDGVVDTSDFNLWNDNKFTSNAAWCAGDSNADGFVDISDFNIWNTHKFTASNQPLLAVPESQGTLVSVWLALSGMLLAIRRPRVRFDPRIRSTGCESRRDARS